MAEPDQRPPPGNGKALPVDGEPFASYVTCITREDGRVVGMEFTDAPDVLAEDAAVDLIDGIFEGLIVL